jgi:hypothetical protein
MTSTLIARPIETRLRCMRDTQVGRLLIPEGANVLPVIRAAHRDPSRDQEPGAFDINRSHRAILAFGAGGHVARERRSRSCSWPRPCGRSPTCRISAWHQEPSAGSQGSCPCRAKSR